MQLFCDLDGVLADFHTGYQELFGPIKDKSDHVNWKAVRNHVGFYENLPPMPDMFRLWNYIHEYDPIILTGVPSSVAEAPENKRSWVRKWLGDSVRIITCLSKEKCLNAKPGDILIDDWTKYRQKWLDVDGIWITHTSAEETIRQLKGLGL